MDVDVVVTDTNSHIIDDLSLAYRELWSLGNRTMSWREDES